MSDWDLAALLAKHGAGWIDNGNPDLARCYCGHRPKLGESWYRHVADALIAAGVTMPAEPEWGPDGSGSYGFGHDVSCDERGRVWLADNDMEPHEALGIAAALLGAANKAEGVTMPAPPEFDGRCQQPVAARGSRPCVLDIGHDGGCF